MLFGFKRKATADGLQTGTFNNLVVSNTGTFQNVTVTGSLTAGNISFPSSVTLNTLTVTGNSYFGADANFTSQFTITQGGSFTCTVSVPVLTSNNSVLIPNSGTSDTLVLQAYPANLSGKSLDSTCSYSTINATAPISGSVASGLTFYSPTQAFNNTASSGTIGQATDLYLGIKTLTATNAITYTRAATLEISGAPVAGSNVTIGTPASIQVDSGNIQVLSGRYLTSSGGTAATPAFTIGGAGGMYSSGSNILNLAANGSNALQLTSTGISVPGQTTTNTLQISSIGTIFNQVQFGVLSLTSPNIAAGTGTNFSLSFPTAFSFTPKVFAQMTPSAGSGQFGSCIVTVTGSSLSASSCQFYVYNAATVATTGNASISWLAFY